MSRDCGGAGCERLSEKIVAIELILLCYANPSRRGRGHLLFYTDKNTVNRGCIPPGSPTSIFVMFCAGARRVAFQGLLL